MTELPPTICDLIARDWLGDATPDEREVLAAWAVGRPEHQVVVARVTRIRELQRTGRQNDLAAAKRRIQVLIASDQSAAPRLDRHPVAGKPRIAAPSRRPRLPRSLPGWTAWGAAVALLGFATPHLHSLLAPIFQSTAAATVKEYRTASAQRARVTLPDSTTIVLAPQSYLRYTTDANTGSRMVTLKGQALFSVTHNRSVPFIVHTGQVRTRVLGTAFSVRQYDSEPAVQVVVAQGRVAVGRAILTAGDVALATSEQRVAVSRGNAVGEQLAWTEGRLVFLKTPLRQVIPELERWYGLTIEVSDPALLDTPVMTTLDTETPAEALDLIAYLVQAKVRMTARHAVLFTR